MSSKVGPLECKSKMEAVILRASDQVKELLVAHQTRLNREYESIRLTHFP